MLVQHHQSGEQGFAGEVEFPGSVRHLDWRTGSECGDLSRFEQYRLVFELGRTRTINYPGVRQRNHRSLLNNEVCRRLKRGSSIVGSRGANLDPRKKYDGNDEERSPKKSFEHLAKDFHQLFPADTCIRAPSYFCRCHFQTSEYCARGTESILRNLIVSSLR